MVNIFFNSTLSYSLLLKLNSACVKCRADGMFKGIYNGKQYHVADIANVLSRAWNAGVDRIIVCLRHSLFRYPYHLWSFNHFNNLIGLMKFYLCVFDNFKNLNEVVLVLLVFNYQIAVCAF